MKSGYNEIYYDAKRDYIWLKEKTLKGFYVVVHEDYSEYKGFHVPHSDYTWPDKAKHQVFLGYED